MSWCLQLLANDPCCAADTPQGVVTALSTHLLTTPFPALPVNHVQERAYITHKLVGFETPAVGHVNCTYKIIWGMGPYGLKQQNPKAVATDNSGGFFFWTEIHLRPEKDPCFHGRFASRMLPI